MKSQGQVGRTNQMVPGVTASHFISLIEELRRPEGLPWGASYSYRKEKETHE